jgi:hypothetical protein
MFNVILRGPIAPLDFRYIRDFRFLWVDSEGHSAIPLAMARKVSTQLSAGNTASILMDANTVSMLFQRIGLTHFEIVLVEPQRIAA